MVRSSYLSILLHAGSMIVVGVAFECSEAQLSHKRGLLPDIHIGSCASVGGLHWP